MLCKNCHKNINAIDINCPYCGSEQEINPIECPEAAIVPDPNYGMPTKGGPEYGNWYLLGGIMLALVTALIYLWPTIQDTLNNKKEEANNTNENSNSNQEPEKEALLSDEIDIDYDDAQLICTVDYDEDDYQSSRVIAIFADENGVVTKNIAGEIIVANEDMLETYKNGMETDLEEMQEYGEVTLVLVPGDGRVTASIEIDLTTFDMEGYAAANENMLLHLNDDYKFTLESITTMYEAQEFKCILK